jgi:hypothetical protein
MIRPQRKREAHAREEARTRGGMHERRCQSAPCSRTTRTRPACRSRRPGSGHAVPDKRERVDMARVHGRAKRWMDCSGGARALRAAGRRPASQAPASQATASQATASQATASQAAVRAAHPVQDFWSERGANPQSWLQRNKSVTDLETVTDLREEFVLFHDILRNLLYPGAGLPLSHVSWTKI